MTAWAKAKLRSTGSPSNLKPSLSLAVFPRATSYLPIVCAPVVAA